MLVQVSARAAILLGGMEASGDDVAQRVLDAVGAMDGDVDSVVAPEGRCQDEADMDASLDVVRSVAALERPMQRGRVHCRLARLGKAVKAARRSLPLAAHVRALIERYNENYAKTFEELIDCSRRKRLVVPGRGRCKLWLPTAAQRACWGEPSRRRQPRKPRRRLLHKTAVGTTHNASVASSREVAARWPSSSTYLGRIRHAVSEMWLRTQHSALLALPQVPLQMLEIALDETE